MKLSYTFFYLFFSILSFAQTPSDTLTLFAEATLSKLDCHNDSTDITVTAFGGTAPYSIFWENTNTSESGNILVDFDWFFVSIASAKSGLYHLEVTDTENKTTSIPLLISQPNPIEFEISTTKTSCLESVDGTATLVNLRGGTVADNYEITWLTLPTQHTKTADSLDVGLQPVLVNDDKNCIVTDTVYIEMLPEIALQKNLNMVTCPMAKDGKIELQIQGGKAPYTYQWSDNSDDSHSKNQDHLSGGLYELTITDASRICQITDSFLIEESLPFEVEWSVDAPICEEKVGLIHIESVKNAMPPVYYSMNNLGFHSETTFGDIDPGFHTLYLKDANNCRASEVFQMPHPKAVILNAGKDALLILGDSTHLDASDRSSPFVDFDWQPTSGLTCSDCPNPTAQPMETTTYSLVATDSSGCVMVDEVTVWIQKNRSVYIPTAFSPDRTGFNDVFTVFGGQDIRFLRGLRVYNRWGNLMFEIEGKLKVNTPEAGWNGKFNGRPMPAGIYLYEANIEFLDGEILPYRGEVYLMR